MQGDVLGTTDGERLLQSGGEIIIKIDPTRGSNDLSLGNPTDAARGWGSPTCACVLG
jgi:hypothetical protein